MANATTTEFATSSAPDESAEASTTGRRAWFLSAAAYLGASLILFHGLLGGLASRAPFAGNGDEAQMAWFLSWIPHALLHGQNPLLTHAINAPTGVNLMWNTSMPLAGLVMAPITLTLGPLASLNLLFILSPFLTAVTGRWWLTRHVPSEAGRFVGGLMCGFGFFVTAHLANHLNFVLLPLVPVMLRLAEDVLWRCAGRVRVRRAMVLGAVTAGQALLSEEIVALVVVGALVVTGVAVLNAPRTVLPALRRALPALLVAAVVAGVLLAAPLYVQLRGPNVVGSIVDAHYFVAAKRDFVIPSSKFLIKPLTQDARLYSHHMNPSEDAVYLGIPLILLLGATAIWWRRRWPVRVAVLTSTVVTVLTFGGGMQADGSDSWTRPAALLFHLPVLDSVLPVRFGLILQLLSAWLLALVVNAGVEAARRRDRRGARRVQPAVGAVALAVSALVAVSLLPAAPPQQVSAQVPSFFTSDAVTSIPQNDLVVLLPVPSHNRTKAMLYQAASGQRFRMVGGYAWSVTDGGRTSAFAPSDPLTRLATLAARRSGGTASITAAEAQRVQLRMGQLSVHDVIVSTADDYRDQRYAETVRKVFGRPSHVVGGVQVWRIDCRPTIPAHCRRP